MPNDIDNMNLIMKRIQYFDIMLPIGLKKDERMLLWRGKVSL